MKSTPEEVQMSSNDLQEGLQMFKGALDNGDLQGYHILVARNGKVILDDYAGWQDAELQIPLQENSLFRMASITKAVTAVAILKLVDQGKVRLSDKVSNYLSSFDNSKSGEITIEQLLLHQAGYTRFDVFHEGITRSSSSKLKAPSLIIEANELGLFGPENIPGVSYRYSNMGYNVLGAVIEIVSGMTLEQFFIKEIYEPLGMMESSHHPWGTDSVRVAKQYIRQNNSWVVIPPWTDYFPRANASLVCTVEDLSKFCQMLLNGGVYNNKRILSESTVRYATEPLLAVSATYLPVEVERSMGYESQWYEYRDSRKLNIDTHRGLGFVVSETGAFSHAGVYGTFAYMDPKEDLMILIMTQSIYGKNPGQTFIEKVYESIL